jgi:splicing factor 3B subunit 1
MADLPEEDDGDQLGSFGGSNRIADREDEYRKRRLNRIISPDRADAFALGDKTPDARVRTYAEVMKEAQLQRERDNTLQNIAQKQKEAEELATLDAKPTKASGMVAAPAAPAAAAATAATAAAARPAGGAKRSRWDSSEQFVAAAPAAEM